MSIQEAYNQWAASYDSDGNRTRDLDQQVTEQVLGGVQADLILEIGCGTGKNSGFLAGRGERLLALDFSERMIRRARAKRAVAQAAFCLADLARPWPCRKGAADLVVCNLVLEHLADLSFIFEEAARVLTAGGQLFVCELHPFRQYLGGRATFEGEQGKVEIPAFVHHISEFLDAAGGSGLGLRRLQEWGDEQEGAGPPRLVSFLFEKGGSDVIGVKTF